VQPEQKARKTIDRLLATAGWAVQDNDQLNLGAAQGVAVREFSLRTGFADYLLFVNRKAVGVVRAKAVGTPLSGITHQSQKYSEGLPECIPAWRNPLPFLYEGTGVETMFTNMRDPDPRSRRVFAFHQPETLAEWAQETETLRSRLQQTPPLLTQDLWPPQIEAICNLEISFTENRPRALIQMATGSGKTFTAVNFVYRLIRHARARRVLFLVDRSITDECHRFIYNLWRQVLEYFDAFLIGLTATPSKQTLGFFNQNLVMEYSRERAVTDGVNVDGEVYCIRTQVTEKGSTVDAGYWVAHRARLTREERWEQLDEELVYSARQLDRNVVTPDQIRTVIRTYRDRLFSEIFPGRTKVPKTLIFAKDDNHAETIVDIVREEFGKGNDFCQKITYKVSGKTPEELIAEFRNSYDPRVAVTVDMVATGTDIKPLEVLLFLRDVKSRVLFEQMLGRGTRVIKPNDLQIVSSDATRPKTAL